MTYTFNETYSGTKTSAANIAEVDPIGSTFSYVRFSSGFNALTNDVVPGDGLTIASSTNNNGQYMISAVLAEQEVVVRAALTASGADGTGQGDVGVHTLNIQDEATIDWSTIATQIARPEVVREVPMAGEADYRFTLFAHLLANIAISTTGMGSSVTWSSEREVACYRQVNDSTPWRAAFGSGDPGDFTLNLGRVATGGSGRDAVQDGSVWIGFDSAGAGANYVNQWRGSFVAAAQDSDMVGGGNDGLYFHCLLYGDMRITNTNNEIQSVSNPSLDGGLALIGSTDFMADFTQCASGVTAAQVLGAPVTATGVKLATGFAEPWVYVFLQNFTVLDPKEDYTMTQLFQTRAGTFGLKSYTYNPTFTLGYPAMGEFVPANGVRVQIFQVNVDRTIEVDGSDDGLYRVTINGVNFDHNAVSETAAQIRTGLINAINAGAEPVTAVDQTVTGLATPFVINADDPDVKFTLSVSAPLSNLVIDEVDEVSVFTGNTDANGQLAAGAGVQLDVTRRRGTGGGDGRDDFRNFRVLIEDETVHPVNSVFRPTEKVEGFCPLVPSTAGGVGLGMLQGGQSDL